MAWKDFKIDKWEEKSLWMKALTVVGFMISIAVFILAALQILNVWDKAINVFEPLLGVLMLMQTIENWKDNRRTAYFSLFVAVFIFVVAFVIIF